MATALVAASAGVIVATARSAERMPIADFIAECDAIGFQYMTWRDADGVPRGYGRSLPQTGDILAKSEHHMALRAAAGVANGARDREIVDYLLARQDLRRLS